MSRRTRGGRRTTMAALLSSLPELGGLGPEEIESLLQYFDEVHIGAGRTLAVAGRPATEYMVVLDGCLEAQEPSDRRTIRGGQTAGWDAMWSRGCSNSTVTATEPSRLLVMGRAQFRAVRALRSRLDEAGVRPLPLPHALETLPPLSGPA